MQNSSTNNNKLRNSDSVTPTIAKKPVKKLVGDRLKKYEGYSNEWKSLKDDLTTLKAELDEEINASSDLLSKRPGAAFRTDYRKKIAEAPKKRTDPARLELAKGILTEARGFLKPESVKLIETIATKKARKNELKTKLGNAWKKIENDTEDPGLREEAKKPNTSAPTPSAAAPTSSSVTPAPKRQKVAETAPAPVQQPNDE